MYTNKKTSTRLERIFFVAVPLLVLYYIFMAGVSLASNEIASGILELVLAGLWVSVFAVLVAGVIENAKIQSFLELKETIDSVLKKTGDDVSDLIQEHDDSLHARFDEAVVRVLGEDHVNGQKEMTAEEISLIKKLFFEDTGHTAELEQKLSGGYEVTISCPEVDPKIDIPVQQEDTPAEKIKVNSPKARK